MTKKLIAIFLVVLTLLLVFLALKDDGSQDAVNAENRRDFVVWLHDELRKSPAEDLIQSKDKSLALAARWSLLEDLARTASGNSDEQLLEHINSFAEAVRDLLSIDSLPEWWKKTLTDGKLNPNYDTYFFESDYQKRESEKLQDGIQYGAEAGVQFIWLNPTIAIATDHDNRPTIYLNDGEVVYFAHMDGFGSGLPYTLFKFNKESQQPAEFCQVYANGTHIDTGEHIVRHFATLMRVNETLIVFGASVEGVYVEAFNVRNGNAILRFSSANFDYK